MMRLWAESYSRSTSDGASAGISLVAHVLLISAAIAATNRPRNLQADWIENRAYYLPPPDRRPSQESSRETIQYVDLAPEGVGSGFGAGGVTDGPVIKDLSAGLGDIGRDLTSSIDAPRLSGGDSIYTQVDVDSVVTRFAGSAAPTYPLDLLKRGIQGSVVTQYVVDTTGLADSASLKIIRTTDELFSDAVRAALPYMRFFPAKVGSKKVRQLVEQEFSFKIGQAATRADQPPGRGY
jgi:TonB family protein